MAVRLSISRQELSDRLEEAISQWRKKYAEEVRKGPSRPRADRLRLEDFLVERRPFFSSIDDSDVFYVNTFRLIEYTALDDALPSKVSLMRSSGYNLGVNLVRSGLVRSLDEASLALALYRVGLLDVVKESLSVMKVNIYECMSCYGAPNLGKTLCDFEAGVLQGVLKELYGPNIVREKYCWGLGFSFCGFEITFE